MSGMHAKNVRYTVCLQEKTIVYIMWLWLTAPAETPAGSAGHVVAWIHKKYQFFYFLAQ